MFENLLSETSFINKIDFKDGIKGSYYFSGVSENLKNIISIYEFTNNNRPFIYIARDENAAKEIYKKVSDILDSDVYYYPKKPITHTFIDYHSMDINSGKVNVIKEALAGNKVFVVASIDSIMEKSVFFKETDIIEKHVEDILDIKELEEILNRFGYSREYEVNGWGAYQVKGGIVDVFIMGDENPTRIEFFDDEIDSIRTFDSVTGKSIEMKDSFTIVPAKTDILSFEQINSKVSKERKKIEKLIKENKDEELDKSYRELLEKIQKDNIDSVKYLMYSFEMKSLIDIFNEPVILFDDYRVIKASAKSFYKENKEDLKDLYEHGKITKLQISNHFKFEEVEEKFIDKDSMIFFDLSPVSTKFFTKALIEIKSADNINYVKNINYLVDTIASYLKNDYKIVAVYRNEKEKTSMSDFLRSYNIKTNNKIEKGSVCLLESNIKAGINLLSDKIFVLTYGDIFIRKGKSVKKRRNSEKHAKAFFSEISKGDYVVHETYGIGRYLGMVNMEAGGVFNDYLEIQFAGDDKLYVIASKMNMVSKYIGTEEKPPKLNRLGSQVWENTKKRTQKAVKELAEEYIKMYAKRQDISGYAYGPDSPWQSEFEQKFGFELTEDQERCINEIKEDMMKSSPMDRLVCGDVGFGKTEVAMRAVFKAVMEGKQCAVLVPTTILAMQHYDTFVDRFKDYPINIEMLSRFKSQKEERLIIDKLKRGKIDILIGTHKILSNKVEFKDLGLLVVDEEQRFGVAHKDKLKLLKENVDTLTLSATPIPRTLNMSLIGVRDLSTIEIPPKEREETETYVIEYDNFIIKEAIKRELERDGQVFFVYNSVKNAEKTCDQLRRLIPGLRVEYANGQMPEKELELTMLRFLNKEFDVLVCTSIVENGLNILNANTMIIKEGNNLGLSQLYQLRGRVGRTNRNAFCYITYEKNRTLNETAVKRLKAINEFTRFGSGFQIAMRDLQIRGAGNILGANQSGHFAQVGYELYTKMLQEAIESEKSDVKKEKPETTISMKLDAFIDKDYIEDEKQRILAYKEIASIETEKDKEEMIEDLIDRYGDVTTATMNLIDISLLRNRASEKEVQRIIVNEQKKQIYFDFDMKKEIDMNKIKELYSKFKGKFVKNDKYIRIGFPYVKTRNVHKNIIKLSGKIIDNMS